MNSILLFFNISGFEFFIIAVAIIVVFGPKRLPEMAKKLGKAVYEVKRATTDIKREIDTEVRKIERDENIKKAEKENPPPENK